MSDRPWPPTPGTYVYRALVKRLPNGRWLRGPEQACVIWFGPTEDPDYPDNDMDRSPRWRALLDGKEVDIDDVWPFVAAEKIDTEKYNELRSLEQ